MNKAVKVTLTVEIDMYETKRIGDAYDRLIADDTLKNFLETHVGSVTNICIIEKGENDANDD